MAPRTAAGLLLSLLPSPGGAWALTGAFGDMPKPPPGPPLPSLPGKVNVKQCQPVPGGLAILFEEAKDADLYEVQLATTADGPTFALRTSPRPVATFDDLVADTSYFVRVRAHAAGAPSLGPGSWGLAGPGLECRTPKEMEPKAESKKVGGPPRKTFVMEMMRESEYTYEVDYLGNHNTGNVLGDAAWATFGARNNRTMWNTTFSNATFTLFCLEVLSANFPDSTTTSGDAKYVNYTSCNNNGDPLRPACTCDIFIDRVIAKQVPDQDCHTPTGDVCSFGPTVAAPAPPHMMNCTCTCTNRSLDLSNRYIGMMPVYQGAPVKVGEWYSVPQDGECQHGEEVGAPRKDGSFCTWRRRPDSRVVRGYEVIAHGFNSTGGGGGGGHFPALDPAQVHQNEAVFRKTFASYPMKPWSCGSAKESVLVV